MITLDSKISDTVGGKAAKAFEKGLGLVTVGDQDDFVVLEHVPLRSRAAPLPPSEVTAYPTLRKAALTKRKSKKG